MLQGVLIAIAISIDSLSVGIAYGVKGTKIPFRSILILDAISVALLSIGFFAGNLLTRIFPPIITDIIGSIIIICIGCWYLFEGWLNYKYPKATATEPTAIAFINIKSLGIAVSVLRDPSKADLDISGTIDTKEAILLGFALAVDSLAVGIIVSLTSLTIIIYTLILVAIMNLVFLMVGISFGHNIIGKGLKNKSSFIPGFILILLGLIRIL